jgi:hypothetical protein
MEDLGLPAFLAYKAYLENNAGEWPVLDSLCGITISRFYRDRGVFDALRTRLLPSLAADVLLAGGKEVLCWRRLRLRRGAVYPPDNLEDGRYPNDRSGHPSAHYRDRYE